MRKNYNTVLISSKASLVPYKPDHVERYHAWMQDPFLLEMTASEPLSMEEEIEMQKSWRDDDNKCTFIVLSTSLLEKGYNEYETYEINDVDKSKDNSAQQVKFCKENVELSSVDASSNLSSNCRREIISLPYDFIQNNIKAMVGDCNIFFHAHESDEELRCAELDIMIAESSTRRSGVGSQATCMMMLYGYNFLGVKRFYAKINVKNEASQQMFIKLGFNESNFVECFQEYEYEYFMTSKAAIKNIENIAGFGMKEYKISSS